MDKFRAFIDKFKRSKSFVNGVAKEYITNNSKTIADFNREQMSVGEDSEGKDFGEYSFWRASERQKRGLQTEFIDLKFEGNFYESIYAEGVRVSNQPAVAINTTSPEDWNAIAEDDRFDKALGINEQNRNKLGQMIAIEIQKQLLKYYNV